MSKIASIFAAADVAIDKVASHVDGKALYEAVAQIDAEATATARAMLLDALQRQQRGAAQRQWRREQV